MNDESHFPDLPPGLTEAQVERVHRAAGECRWQIEHPSTDFPIAERLETDLIVSICKAYETGRGIWHADDLEQVIAARDALKEASDAARESGNTEVLDAARTVVNALNDLYVEIDTAIRAINVAAVEKATALAVLHRDQSVPRAAARAETRDVGEQVEALEGEIAAAEQAQQLIRNQINVNVLNNLTLQFGDLTVTIQKLKASLASVNISFRMKELFSGMIEVGGERLAEALAEVKQAAASFGKSMEGVADVTEALEKLLAPLARVAEGGERLVRTVRAAWRKLFGPREPLPWPTGLRLLPPEGTDNEPRDVELVELRRFEGVEGITFGLAPLSGGQFVSGGEDKTLRLWSVTEPTPLVGHRAHPAGRTPSTRRLDRSHRGTESGPRGYCVARRDSGSLGYHCTGAHSPFCWRYRAIARRCSTRR